MAMPLKVVGFEEFQFALPQYKCDAMCVTYHANERIIAQSQMALTYYVACGAVSCELHKQSCSSGRYISHQWFDIAPGEWFVLNFEVETTLLKLMFDPLEDEMKNI